MPQSTLARTAVVVCLILALGLLGALGWRLAAGDRSVEVGGSGTAAIGGPFTLVDQDGKRRSDTDFRGQILLVFFGYTHCPDVCPTGLQTISDALDALGADAAKVTPLFITVDPARDTVAQMKEYAGHFHPRLVALTGTEAEVAQAAHAYRVYYAKAASDSGEEYLMDHSGFVYVMDGDGRYLTHFGPDGTAQTMAETLRAHL